MAEPIVLNTSLQQSIKLDVPGEDGYTISTFEESDVEALIEVINMESVNNNLISLAKPYTLEHANWWLTHNIQNQTTLLPLTTLTSRLTALQDQSFPIPLQVLRHNGRLIGGVSLSPLAPSHQEATSNFTPLKETLELGYYLHPSHQGKRIMVEAVGKLFEYARREWGLKKVFVMVSDGNVGSRKVVERLREGKECENGRGSMEWPAEKCGGLKGEKVERACEWWYWTIE